MKYLVVQTSNHNPDVQNISAYDDNIKGARIKFHQNCANLWNSNDVETGSVKITDENWNVIDGYQETIDKPSLFNDADYAVLRVSDDNFGIVSEHKKNLKGAIVSFHQLSAALLNDPNLGYAIVTIIDNGLNPMINYKEMINNIPVEKNTNDNPVKE